MISDIYAALKDAMKLKPWEILLGEEYLNEQDSPPRIVIYPTFETFELPSQRTQPTRLGITNQTSTIAIVLLKRSVTLEAALWGCDFDEVELMLPEFVGALDFSTNNQASYGTAVWVSSTPGGSFQERGRVLKIPFTVPFKIIGTPPVLAKITEVIDTEFLEPNHSENI